MSARTSLDRLAVPLLLAGALGTLAAPAAAQPVPDPEPGPEPVAEPAPEPQSPEPAPDPVSEQPKEAPKAAPAPAPEPEPEEPSQPPISADEKRAMPDYDGRGEEPTTAGDVLLWVPRTLVYPIYLIAEYGLRYPLGKVTAAIEQNEIPELLQEFFTFGPEGKFGIVPSFLIDFGFRPSIGLYFFGDDVGIDKLSLRSHAAFGGIDWYRATATVRYHIHEDTNYQSEKFVQIKGVYSHRPDWKFYGIGPTSDKDEESRFGAQQIEGIARYEGGFWRTSKLSLWGGVRDTEFKDISCCDDIQLRDAVAQGFYGTPALYDDGYTVAGGGVDVTLDTREKRFAHFADASDFVSPSGTGVKLAGRAQVWGGIRDTPATPSSHEGRLGWIKYGGTLGGYVDLFNQRVLGAQVIVDFVDPFDPDGDVPFLELVSLGGSRPMRGFLDYRLLDRSSAVAQLEYTWPIWVSLDGSLTYAVGNVFGDHLEELQLGLARQSFAFGFKANSSRDHAFELLLAVGTKTFDEGSTFDTFRFVFGATEGF
jgi:hypothetical protein